MTEISRTGSTLFGILCLTLLCPTPASAHHQLGLPHYLYSEDYPQIPTMVIEADAEGFDVTFSTFPGNPQPGETVRMKVYIKHGQTGEVYQGPVELSISRVTFFGGETMVVEPRVANIDYNEFKLSHQFEEAEKYHVNVVFEPRADFVEKIPFPIVIGETDFSVVPIVFGLGLLAVFVAVGVGKRRKRDES